MTETQPVLGNNAQAQQLSKTSTEKLSNKNSTLSVSEKNQESISGDPKLFPLPLAMMRNFPRNDNITDNNWQVIKTIENSLSESYTFEKSSFTGSIIKIKDCYFSADAMLKKGAALLKASTKVDFLPRPLNSWAKSIQLGINSVNVTIAHTDNMGICNLINLLYTSTGLRHDIEGIKLGYLDTAGKMSVMGDIAANNAHEIFDANKGAKARRKVLVNKTDVYVMDKPMVPLFNNGNQYITSSNNLSLMWTRGSKKIFTVNKYNNKGNNLSFHNGRASVGEEALLNSIDAHINNFEFHLKYLTPSNQIKQNLNYMLEQKGDMVKSYVTQVHCVTKLHSKDTANLSFTNIFNASLPYLCFFFTMC